MPALEVTSRIHDAHPALGHVNLMVDTFIANASADDLRSIVRTLLATGPPGVANTFASAARARLCQTNARSPPNSYALFRRQTREDPPKSTTLLSDTLARARSLYGAGMGFASLGILASVIRATIGLRWDNDGDMADVLAVIDADVGQAIQSSKEEMEGGRVNDISAARETVLELRRAVKDSSADVQAWGGEFPFERASASIEYWKF